MESTPARTQAVGTIGMGYPLLLCLDKSLVVILNYALTAEQPDPCGPEPCSPGRAAPDPLPAWGGSGDATYPGGGSLQPKQLGPRTSSGVPDPRRVPDPHILSGPLSGEGTDTPPGAGPEPPAVLAKGYLLRDMWRHRTLPKRGAGPGPFAERVGLWTTGVRLSWRN